MRLPENQAVQTKSVNRYAWIWIVALLVLTVHTAMLLPQRLNTGMSALLPEKTSADAVWSAADRAAETQLNSRIAAAVGSEHADAAFQAASEIAAFWQHSGLFDEVNVSLMPDMDALRGQIETLGVAVLPKNQADILQGRAAEYFARRAEDAVNPFSGSLMPLEQDWLGLSRFFLHKHQTAQMQWNAENGMMYLEENGKTWVWLYAVLPENGYDARKLSELLDDTRTRYADNAEILASGGALFAAAAKLQAEKESTLMSAAGLLLTFGMLLAVFRSIRIFSLLIPLAAGMVCGLAAVLGLFGEIHILTVVVGVSLIGALVDFPLHWLAPSLFEQGSWQAAAAMRRIKSVFALSLGITAAGYILLWFAPLPILQQTAVFSTAALAGSFISTLWLLPPVFGSYRSQANRFSGCLKTGLQTVKAVRFRLIWLLPVVLIAVYGANRSNWRDDIRNWMSMPAELLQQSAHIARLSGIDGGGRSIVVEADTDDRLLLANRVLAEELVRRGIAAERIRGLHQWLLPEREQNLLKQHLKQIAAQPDSYRALSAIGIPESTVRTALLEAAARPDISLSESLQSDMAEAWRLLYLGRQGKRYASLLRLENATESDWHTARTVLANRCNEYGCARLVDKRSHLNTQFAQTRNQALGLKLLSFVLAWLLLWRLFGLKRGSVILLMPVAVSAAVLSVLGLSGITVGLFALFGLLLSTAIGIDYAVYVLTAPESLEARAGGVTLAALTTGISFGLLAFSSTPAVAAFGVTVFAGCCFNWLAAIGLLSRQAA